MVLFNYAIREITTKLVYYGPGLGGKTSNIQYIHSQVDPQSRGKLLSLATDSDRTLFFDFLPLDLGSIGGYRIRFQLYTVPGQVHYNATRRLVLKGVDAVVFVADSQIEMTERNRESFENLAENLAENGYEMANIPIVIQLNKRDLPGVASREEMVEVLGAQDYQVFDAVATKGEGVFESLKAIVKLTMTKLKVQFAGQEMPAEELAEQPVAPPVSSPESAPGMKPLQPDLVELTQEEFATPGEDSLPKKEETLLDEDSDWMEVDLDDGIPEAKVNPPEEEVESLFGEGLDQTHPFSPAESPMVHTSSGDQASQYEGLSARVEEIYREVQQLREENRKINVLLKRVFEGIDRQIEALRHSKDELQEGGNLQEPEPGRVHEEPRREEEGDLF